MTASTAVTITVTADRISEAHEEILRIAGESHVDLTVDSDSDARRVSQVVARLIEIHHHLRVAYTPAQWNTQKANILSARELMEALLAELGVEHESLSA